MLTVKYPQEAQIYKHTPGRKMPGIPGYKRKLDFDFKVEIESHGSKVIVHYYRGSTDFLKSTAKS